jgi:hypothetical protein
MFWLGQLIRSVEMSLKTVSNEQNQKYLLSILAIYKLTRIQKNFQGIFAGRTSPG